ncbi:uncharacterized protein BDR25DRAFT_302847 [Lindgomyces ingoldianus]|uniref:Uncharacterized protein n=1 Tax=Lindgomyces ingoldianus TaxID=673940 RepID=A0ACB6QYD0_9PLEO|nr:uncharacterized protein BDR25DRAFT_302847 [Lindgomyces ingoldianus]KAF2472044.1 hypothetical protein BDR25DRAFT_302847 [Lindgomyces ingoldianus]
MLYRSAYAERTKQWCLQNNHQIVSSVSGESWPLEPPEIRELYNEYAKIERMNHQHAHPTYKFSPSKTAPITRKRKGECSDNEEPSDLDDREWGPGNRKSKVRVSPRPERDLSYAPDGMGPEFFDQFDPNGNGINKSIWDMSNEGRLMPMPVAQSDLYSQYYQTPVHPSMAMAPGVMEHLRMRRIDTTDTSMHFASGHALLGLPGGYAADGMEQFHSSTDTHLGEPQVDPMLLAFDGGHYCHDVDSAMAQHLHPEFRNGHIGMMERELNQDSVHSLLGGGPNQDDFHSEPWHPDPTMAPMEQGSEFEKWMDDDRDAGLVRPAGLMVVSYVQSEADALSSRDNKALAVYW